MEVKEQRRKEIAAFVEEMGEVSFAQLKEKFPTVSEMTLRTDLKELDLNQQLVRIHGGAKALRKAVGNDDFLNLRFVRHTEDKKKIAQKAAALIQEYDTVFIDSGSTTTMLTQVMKDQHNIIVTSGVTCASELARLTKANVIMLGGNMNRHSLSVNGIDSIRAIEKLNFDVAMIGVTRYNAQRGFTCEALADAELKRTAIKKADKVIILMDSSKINQKGTTTFCTLDQVDAIVSDDKLPEEFINECNMRGIRVY